MSKVFRANRKATDEDIVRLNSVGLSLATIGKILGCHQTTIKVRLEQLGIRPADTRRTFMEDIYNALPEAQKRWLESELSGHHSVKDYIKGLLTKAFIKETSNDFPGNALGSA